MADFVGRVDAEPLGRCEALDLEPTYHRDSVEICTPWGSTKCEYLYTLPGRDAEDFAPWPLLCLLTGKAEIRNVREVEDWVFSSRHLHPLALSTFIVLVPLVSEDCALYRDWNTVNVEAMWHLICVAISRLQAHLDCRKICITGYSLGADIALGLALRYGSHLSSVALFSGQYDFLAEDIDELGKHVQAQVRHLRLRAFHSASDSYVLAERTRAMFRWLCDLLNETTTDLRICYDDPHPPSWDPSAKLDFVVTKAGSLSRSMWLWQDYVYQGDDVWKGYRKRRPHVLWDQFFLYEDTFGLFEWLSQGMTATQDIGAFHFKVILPASAAGFGLSMDVADTVLCLGPGYHLDGARSRVRLWNRRLRAGSRDGSAPGNALQGDATLCLLPGDEILEVNGRTAVEAMQMEMACPRGVSLHVRRASHLTFTSPGSARANAHGDSQDVSGIRRLCHSCARRAKRYRNDI